MNFKEIIKQEWEEEFPNDLGEPVNIEDSIFDIYQELVERICAKVWNSAIETAAHDVSNEPIIRLKIDEQGTDTTEV